MKYNVTVTVRIPKTYNDNGEVKSYDYEQEITWERCTEDEMIFLIHLIRDNMTLTVEACTDEES